MILALAGLACLLAFDAAGGAPGGGASCTCASAPAGSTQQSRIDIGRKSFMPPSSLMLPRVRGPGDSPDGLLRLPQRRRGPARVGPDQLIDQNEVRAGG